MQIKTPGNEINYLLQQTRVHHMQLSSMADLKANMLLTMSSIVVTLAAPRVVVDGALQWPLVMLIVFSLVTIVLAGFGRAASEVGAVMIVGGNIDGVTRVMTTAIALETSKGDLPLALGLGLVLISVVLVLNAAAFLVKEAAQRSHG